MLQKVENHCRELLGKQECHKLPFHNIKHTEEVVENVKQIASKVNLSEHETDLLIISAWFHDTGFIEAYKGHDEVSKSLAREYLTKEEFSAQDIDIICTCIDGTKMPQEPKSELAKILCDADLMHLSSSNFYYRKLLLRRELELFHNLSMTDLEWHKFNLEFIENHHYKSDYGINSLEKEKQKNIDKVEFVLSYYR